MRRCPGGLRALSAIAVACAFLVASTGCLQRTHQIPRGELARLAATDPHQRGEGVRVVQDLFGEQPPPAPAVDPGADVTIVVIGDVGGGPYRPPPQDRPPSGSTGKVPGGSKLAGAKADEAWALFVVAAAFAVVLAFTEGARYDGWVRLHPMHPVHLWGPGGYTVLPLAHIDPSVAAWADRAVIVPDEGPWQELGRAPLDRAGFTYSVLLGAGTVTSGDDSQAVGTAGRVQFGYFPTHHIGVQLDWGFAFRDNVVGETIFDSRLGGELTFAPVSAGPIHAGVFGGLALATRFEDGLPGGRTGRADDTALSGGALVQLELTTRLALTGRFGVVRAYGEVTEEAQVGLSIY